MLENFRKWTVLMVSILLCAPLLCSGAHASVPANAEGELLQFVSGGHVLGFGKSAMYVASRNHMLKVALAGGRSVAPAATAPEGPSGAARSNTAPPLGRVSYAGVWDGVTVVYENGDGGIVKSTYHIDAGAGERAVGRIRLAYNRPVHLNTQGDLVVAYDTGQMIEAAPVAWQQIGGKREPVAVAYRLLGDSEVGFEASGCDPAFPLVIDPWLTWNTFLGGTGYDQANSIAVDGSNGNVYVAGSSGATWGNPVRSYTLDTDAFAAKLASDGSLTWNTFLGGDGNDFGYSVAVDGSNGNVYVAGYSNAAWTESGLSPVLGYT